VKILITIIALLCSTTILAEPRQDPELNKLKTALAKAASQNEMNLASHNLKNYWDVKLLEIEKKIESKLDDAQ
jgi:hypothetical protein